MVYWQRVFRTYKVYKVPRHLALIFTILALGVLDFKTPNLPLTPLYALAALAAGWLGGWRGVLLVVSVSTTAVILADSYLLVTDRSLVPIVESEFRIPLAGRLMDGVFQALCICAWLIIGGCAVVLRRKLRSVHQQREELKHDLEVASGVQSAFLAHRRLSDPRLEVFIHFATARQLGGDFHDIRIEGDKLKIFLADVSGKGTPAALVTGMLRGLFEEGRLATASPAALLARMNARVYPFLPDTMFVTCLYAIWDLNEGQIVYANAGHDSPLLRRASGTVEELTPTGSVLGITTDFSVEARTVDVHPDDLLLLYTDGLTSQYVDGGGRLGDDALRIAVERFVSGSCEQLAKSMLVPSPRLEDDIVLMVLRSRKPNLPPVVLSPVRVLTEVAHGIER